METGGLMADKVYGLIRSLCTSANVTIVGSSVRRERFLRSPVEVCVTYTMFTVFTWGGLLLTPGICLVSLFVVAITGRPLPLVFGIELAGLF